MIAAGIVDPAKVTRSALQNAAFCGCQGSNNQA
jgi:chaperonin GroEL (HSP60 family)